MSFAGVDTSDSRLKALVRDTTRPRTYNEREIAGYRDVLNTIHENYEYIPPKPPIILQMHRDIVSVQSGEAGGEYELGQHYRKEKFERKYNSAISASGSCRKSQRQ